MKGTVKLSMNIPHALHRAAKAKAKELLVPATSVLRAWMQVGAEVDRAERETRKAATDYLEGVGKKVPGTGDEGGGAGGVRGAAPGDGRDGNGDRSTRRAKDGSS